MGDLATQGGGRPHPAHVFPVTQDDFRTGHESFLDRGLADKAGEPRRTIVVKTEFTWGSSTDALEQTILWVHLGGSTGNAMSGYCVVRSDPGTPTAVWALSRMAAVFARNDEA